MANDSRRPKEWIACAPPAPPRDIGDALAALSEDDLLRLRAIARLRARSLPGGISWSDLLHEAVVRALAGTRPVLSPTLPTPRCGAAVPTDTGASA